MGQRLAKSELAKLQRVVASGDFESEEAMDLDNAIMELLTSDDLDYASLWPLDGPQSEFFSAWWLEGEVNNGGFDQFFSNKGPFVATKALKFCREHQLDQVAQLLSKAIALVGQQAMSSSDALQERLCAGDKALAERIDVLDGLFFALDPYPPFVEARLRFVATNPASFFR